MKQSLPTSFGLALLLASCILAPEANAQGCHQVVLDLPDITCCGTYQQENSTCQSSVVPGDYSLFCTLGSGDCCGQGYHLANTVSDPQECGYCNYCDNGDILCGNPPGGCCQPPIGGCGPHYLWRSDLCQCVRASPIIVDTTGEGFHLTSAQDGVAFDIAGDGHPVQMGWTAATSRNAFLALDRNHNGKIDDGTELFGNFTPQPKSDDPNGFLALAVFDRPENGGNGDGIIDHRDAVFSHLVLWIDENHDGISQPDELHSLPELGVFSLALKYKESRRTDEFGNEFRYKAAVNPDPHDGESKDGRWTFDVFFLLIDSPSRVTSAMQRRPLLFARNRCGRGQVLLGDGLDFRSWGFSHSHGSPIVQRNDCGGGR
jgi:hypothetical protein